MNKLKSVFSHVVKAIGGFDLVIPVSVGLFFYAFFSRFHGLNPTQTDWLLPFWNGNIDSAANLDNALLCYASSVILEVAWNLG